MENNYRYLKDGDIVESTDEMRINERKNLWAAVGSTIIGSTLQGDTTFFRRPIKEAQ